MRRLDGLRLADRFHEVLLHRAGRVDGTGVPGVVLGIDLFGGDLGLDPAGPSKQGVVAELERKMDGYLTELGY